MTRAGPTTVVIRNKRGLHARASARFVTCAPGVAAVVPAATAGARGGGTSIWGLMMRAAAPGDDVELSAEGAEAEAALAALVALIDDRFGED